MNRLGRILSFAALVMAPTSALPTEIKPSVLFPSQSWIGIGWPPNLTDGCFDRGACTLPPSELVIVQVQTPSPMELVTSSPECNPNYAGSCVPTTTVDVDCVGSNENGPSFVGPVRVVGRDIFKLDADGDGVACEK